jgi:hypothetical protein
MVFNRVIGPAVEQTRDCGPLVANPRVGAYDGVVFFRSESTVLYLRRELVAPP